MEDLGDESDYHPELDVGESDQDHDPEAPNAVKPGKIKRARSRSRSRSRVLNQRVLFYEQVFKSESTPQPQARDSRPGRRDDLEDELVKEIAVLEKRLEEKKKKRFRSGDSADSSSFNPVALLRTPSREGVSMMEEKKELRKS